MTKLTTIISVIGIFVSASAVAQTSSVVGAPAPNVATPGAVGPMGPMAPTTNTAGSSGDTSNALGATSPRADASWCRSAGLNANDTRGCVARMNISATDQQREDIQATYRSRVGSGAATRSAGGMTATNSRLNSGLNIGAGQTPPSSTSFGQ